ncbi:MAG: biopolymer transporter ExbD [Chthoniobacter sp.]|uniref:ExbD/TolR family protein n=1 Tax=Chthoniobacter sp. TaxID=2510640 RepID=UPI0032A490F7
MSPPTNRTKAEVRLAPEEGPEFQIAPMIDILLVLLVFFMSISSTEVLQASPEVTLPAARNGNPPAAQPGGQVIVNVTWNTINNVGGIEVDSQRFDRAEELLPILKMKVQANPDLRVLIRADRAVHYDFLKKVIVAAGQAGIGKVTFSVTDKDAPATTVE